jgi:methionyl-tRNA formyltransferase
MIISDDMGLKTKDNFRILFMGTPEFAAGTLKRIVEHGFKVVAVITAPSKPAGRGRQIRHPEVREYASAIGIPVLQPVSLKDPAFIQQLASYSADLFVVVAFRMLPEIVWQLPKYGTINLHASLLPQFRGAAPIQHAIMQGEKITGVTTFFIEKEIDTGNILLQEQVEISLDDNAGTLQDKLMATGGHLLIRTIEGIMAGTLNPLPQSDLIHDEKILKTAPKIFREQCRINFHQSVNQIYNLIRGLSPAPGAWCVIHRNNHSSTLRVYRSSPEPSDHQFNPGTFITDHRSYLKVAVPDGFIHLLEIQPESRNKMIISEFLKGLGKTDLLFE